MTPQQTNLDEFLYGNRASPAKHEAPKGVSTMKLCPFETNFGSENHNIQDNSRTFSGSTENPRSCRRALVTGAAEGAAAGSGRLFGQFKRWLDYAICAALISLAGAGGINSQHCRIV
jgi:hypothetical protein